ncbi:hypothetical protein ALI22I_20445 [Saccharothrix sp. ALI-22-I]|nr:hypothetical protein ALI22I_20445 [Saccharothrix sp. ALI-22-I]
MTTQIALNPGTATVTFHGDGTAEVHLRAVMVARKDVTGIVYFGPDTTVTSNDVEDSFASTPLKSHVLNAAARRAQQYLAAARRQALAVLDRATTTTSTGSSE